MTSQEFPDVLYPEYLTYSDQPHEVLLDQWPVTTMVSSFLFLCEYFYFVLPGFNIR